MNRFIGVVCLCLFVAGIARGEGGVVPFNDPEFWSINNTLERCNSAIDALQTLCFQNCASGPQPNGPGMCIHSCKATHRTEFDSCYEAFAKPGDYGGGGGISCLVEDIPIDCEDMPYDI